MNPTPIFLNGSRYWLRLRLPGGARPRLSTGTTNEKLAKRIAAMVDELLEDRTQRHLVARLAAGETDLATVYDHRSRGQLGALSDALEAPAVSDLEPLVGKWIAEKLPLRSTAGAQLKADYARQVRAIFPAGVPFPASLFTEDELAERLNDLTDSRTGEPLTGSTLRRYVAPLRLFYRYARKQIVGLPNPFEDLDWLPANNPARSKHWDHATVLKVLALMSGEAQIAMGLVFAAGMELGALLALTSAHIVGDADAGRGLVIAPGTKNNARRDRTIYVDAWAWQAVKAYAEGRKGLLFDFGPQAKRLREAFYLAQVAAGLIDEPEVSASGKRLWAAVDPHTIHDARHSYCYCRLLGDDGEPRQSLKFCSKQLGHATEQMVMTIYGKDNIEDRVAQLEKREAITAAVGETK